MKAISGNKLVLNANPVMTRNQKGVMSIKDMEKKRDAFRAERLAAAAKLHEVRMAAQEEAEHAEFLKNRPVALEKEAAARIEAKRIGRVVEVLKVQGKYSRARAVVLGQIKV